MKNLLPLLIITLLLFSCKKDVDQFAFEKDSLPVAVQKDIVSFTIAGVTYTYNQEVSFDASNYEANRTLDSVSKKGIPYISSDPDTLLFGKAFGLVNTSTYDGGIKLTFFKKQAKRDLMPGNELGTLGILSPADVLQLYRPGNYLVPVDFGRWNRFNGTALELTRQNVYLSSFDQSFPGYTSNVANDGQADAIFEIVALKQDKHGYVVEANFSLNLFDKDGVAYKVEKGYLKIHI